tara:strand:- start:17792 stop:18019 length:228 start_codon:yes stop_codon:yes gene_type:complete
VTLSNGSKLYNGEPVIKVTKMCAGYYQWATKIHGRWDHTLLSYVEDFMKRYGYEFKIVEQKEEDVEDDFYVPFYG